MLRRIRPLAGVIIALAMTGGCYQYVPVEMSSPPVGRTIAFDISDRGRVELADRMGPGLARIEGRLVGTTGEIFVVNVFRVAHINGVTSQWSGETVRLDRSFVQTYQERELSRRRSWLLAGAVTATVLAVVLTRGLWGKFLPDNTEGPPVDDPDSRIFRYP